MHPLQDIKRSVDKTHKGLGNLVAFSCLAASAKQAAIIVAPSGTGKSTVGLMLKQIVPDTKILDSLTRAGLSYYQDDFNGFEGLLVMDDLGKIDTDYTRRTTLKTLTELTFSHFVEDHTGFQHLSISDFYGSAIMNCQPAVMSEVLRSAEWEANLQDKTIRYYHLNRPLKPEEKLPIIEHDYPTVNFDTVKFAIDQPGVKELMANNWIQWGRARGIQHITHLLKASAVWAGRDQVTKEDIKVLNQLLRPVWAEQYFVQRDSLGGERKFLADYYYLLCEFASYGKVSVNDIVQDYKVSEKTAYRYLDKYKPMWEIVRKRPTLYGASKETKQILGEIA